MKWVLIIIAFHMEGDTNLGPYSVDHVEFATEAACSEARLAINQTLGIFARCLPTGN